MVSLSYCEFGMSDIISGRSNGWVTCIVEWLSETAILLWPLFLVVLRLPRVWDTLCTKLSFYVLSILFWYLLHVWVFLHIYGNMGKCESSLILFCIWSSCTVSLPKQFCFCIWLYCTIFVRMVFCLCSWDVLGLGGTLLVGLW